MNKKVDKASPSTSIHGYSFDLTVVRL